VDPGRGGGRKGEASKEGDRGLGGRRKRNVIEFFTFRKKGKNNDIKNGEPKSKPWPCNMKRSWDLKKITTQGVRRRHKGGEGTKKRNWKGGKKKKLQVGSC